MTLPGMRRAYGIYVSWKSLLQDSRLFNDILLSDDPSVRYEFMLKPGRPMSKSFQPHIPTLAFNSDGETVFDNWRVLHGRSAFTGARRMCGGYGKGIVTKETRNANDSPSQSIETISYRDTAQATLATKRF